MLLRCGGVTLDNGFQCPRREKAGIAEGIATSLSRHPTRDGTVLLKYELRARDRADEPREGMGLKNPPRKGRPVTYVRTPPLPNGRCPKPAPEPKAPAKNPGFRRGKNGWRVIEPSTRPWTNLAILVAVCATIVASCCLCVLCNYAIVGDEEYYEE